MLASEGETYAIVAGIMIFPAVGHMGIHIAQADGRVFCAAVSQARTYAPVEIIGASTGRVCFAINPQGAGGIQVGIELLVVLRQFLDLQENIRF